MPPPSPAPSRIPRWLPALLGYFIAVGPAATDMYLPAFPAVEHSFGTAPGTAQLT
ncbi:MAG TPA: multidrug transporter CflA, partial [Acetobacteraceae bacterium]|nr:multidrug transporter CflA [Acetobacteraceae bacterium]